MPKLLIAASHFLVSLKLIHLIAAERGRAAALLKPASKRKRTISEIADVREEEKELKKDKQSYFQQVKKLKKD